MAIIQKLSAIRNNLNDWNDSRKWNRDKSIVLFGAWFGERYADTSRYLFQYLSDNKEKYGLTHVVWVTRSEVVKDEIADLGYEAYMMDSEESLYYHKTAATHVICNMSDISSIYAEDIMGRYSFGAHKVNLWHGVMPMKGVAAASNSYKKQKQSFPLLYMLSEFLSKHCRLYRCLMHSHGGWGDCFYLSVTPTGTDMLQKFFLLPRNHFIETGNPRVCGSVSFTKREKEFYSILKQYRKSILYLPTFRDANSSFDFNHVAEPLQDFLKEKGILWIQKAHTAAASATYTYRQEGNIISLSSDFDINSIMKDITLLVTDFSSVAADAMYYYKPIIYYMPDYDEYMNKDRGFVVDPETIIMGPKTFNSDELRQVILENIDTSFSPGQRYLDTRFKYWGPDKSMDEIWNDIKKTIHL